MTILNLDKIVQEKWGLKEVSDLPFRTVGHNRLDLARLFGELGYKRGAEIGVLRGVFSKIICESSVDVVLVCVDPWERFGNNSQRKMNDLYELAKERLEPYKVEILRMTSGEASRKIPDGSLDFVYIDGLHDFDSVIQDILWWVPKVRVGGIVSGHDYFNSFGFGVVLAVDNYTRDNNINPWYVTVEYAPSWFWVKK